VNHRELADLDRWLTTEWDEKEGAPKGGDGRADNNDVRFLSLSDWPLDLDDYEREALRPELIDVRRP